MIITSSFYKYVTMDSPEQFRDSWLQISKTLGIRGKILVGTEGINGTVSGTQDQIDAFEAKIREDPRFSDLTFRQTPADRHPFKKMIVRVRPEIIHSSFNVSLETKGDYVTSESLKTMLDNREDIILLDARNDYESKIGKFKDAIAPDIKVFRQFQDVAKNIDLPKDKKIVMYCTGGVRCEKASAAMKKEGFTNVSQLHGGIIDYINKFPDTHFEGRCFVFDARLSIPSGPKNSVITVCELCHNPAGDYINCAHKRCDKMFVVCQDCRKNMIGTCSKNCKNIVSMKLASAQMC